MFERFDGASWADAKNVRRWDGAAWQDCQFARRWDGSKWVDVWANTTYLFKQGTGFNSMVLPVKAFSDFGSHLGWQDPKDWITDSMILLNISTWNWTNWYVFNYTPINMSAYNKIVYEISGSTDHDTNDRAVFFAGAYEVSDMHYGKEGSTPDGTPFTQGWEGNGPATITVDISGMDGTQHLMWFGCNVSADDEDSDRKAKVDVDIYNIYLTN